MLSEEMRNKLDDFKTELETDVMTSVDNVVTQEKVIIKPNMWLREKELVVGNLYIVKDARVLCYLGKDIDGYNIFYNCGSLSFVEGSDTHGIAIANYDVQIKHATEMYKDLLSKTIYGESIIEMKGIPKLHCVFPYVNIRDTYKQWYIESEARIEGLPKLASIANIIPNRGFVDAKDLVPGNLYYAGNCWGNTWIYLGRTSSKKFVWYYVGNEDCLRVATGVSLMSNSFSYIETTSSKKKVKPLAEALNDKFASVFKETEQLIESGFVLDMNGVTQEQLDLMEYRRNPY